MNVAFVTSAQPPRPKGKLNVRFLGDVVGAA
jgi:hypothetical protein